MMITAAYARAFPAVDQLLRGTATRTGTLTTDSATVTGLSTTADLSVGAAVYGNGVPDGTVILAIVSGSTITLSQNATETGTRSLTFPVDALADQLIAVAQQTIETYIGYPVEEDEATEYYSGDGRPDLILARPNVSEVADVRIDPTGAWGQGPSAFPSSSALAVGVGYALNLDRQSTVGKSGLLRYLGGGNIGLWPGGGRGYGGGLVPVRQRPGWPVGDGNIRVTYTAGWAEADIPADLKQACVNLVAFLAKITPQGGQSIQSESLGKYSYTLGAVNLAQAAAAGLAAAGELGTTRQLLSRYRTIVLG